MHNVAIIDHNDSFTHNLARYFKVLGAECNVVDYQDLHFGLEFSHLVLSPGPLSPDKYPKSKALLAKAIGKKPILGICLGHQLLASYYGFNVIRAKNPCHGGEVAIKHDGLGLFYGLAAEIKVGCYNSLVVEFKKSEHVVIDAYSSQGEVMSLRHMSLPVFGLQFHPESVNTLDGMQLIKCFLEYGL